MPIYKYAKGLLVSPAIGSAVIGIFGLLLGVVLVSGKSQSGKRMAADSGQHAAHSGVMPNAVLVTSHPAPAERAYPVIQKNTPGSGARHVIVRRFSRPNIVAQEASNMRRNSLEAHFDQVVFQKPIANNQFGFLNEYAGRQAKEVIHEQKLRILLDTVVPYTLFHYGLDMPLPNVIEVILSRSRLPVEIRQGRYVMVPSHRGFIWIDMQQGIVLGGIFFYPRDGEPTPTLTIFSRQVSQKSIGMSQLPPEFVQDVGRWAAMVGAPSLTTRYFINASGKKIVLVHDENFCSHANGMPAPSEDVCKEMNAWASDIDMQAANFLEQTHFASNATMRMVGATSQLE